LSFNNVFDIGDIISTISLLVVIFGGFFGYHQWKKTIKINRANYLNELTEKIRTDEDISEMIYLLDYEYNWYNKSFHGSDGFERKMDKTLSYFSYICYLYENNHIEEKEFYFFKYEIERILMNPSTVNYLYNIYHFSNKCNTPITFKYLFEYGQKHDMFTDDFFSPCSIKHPHYLNF